MNCKFCNKELPKIELFSSVEYGNCDCGGYEYRISYWDGRGMSPVLGDKFVSISLPDGIKLRDEYLKTFKAFDPYKDLFDPYKDLAESMWGEK